LAVKSKIANIRGKINCAFSGMALARVGSKLQIALQNRRDLGAGGEARRHKSAVIAL
jgi:hypothetical protein